MPQDIRSKYFCFTLNNYNEEEEQTIQTLARQEDKVTYLVYGREVGENGTRHLQGYVEFLNRQRFAGVKRMLGNRVHLEKRLGTSIEASEYCKKDGDVFEHGTLSISKQGQRNDLIALHQSLKEKRSLIDISDEHFSCYVKYERAIKSYKLLHSPSRNPNNPPSVICYWGNTGLGKTRSVWDNARSIDDIWVYPGKSWFDGYDDHPIALFDEFRGSSMELHMLLQILDRYPIKVRVKGSHANWNPEEIYLTSNIHPIDWYPNVDQPSRDALMRRFTNIYHFE